MATTVDTKGLDRKLKELNKAMTIKAHRDKMGPFIIKMIRKRTRTEGKGVSRTGGNLRTLKQVSFEWAKYRATQRTHPSVSVGSRKSNLTFKGTMLNSLTVQNSTRSLIIGFKTQRQAAKAEGNEARGRPFMNLGRVEIKKASDFLKQNILKKIK